MPPPPPVALFSVDPSENFMPPAPIVTLPVIFAFPTTVNFWLGDGVDVPMPTLPPK